MVGTSKYAIEQIMEFREAFGLRTNSLEKLDKMFGMLFHVVVNVRDKSSQLDHLWDATCIEWQMRRPFFLEVLSNG